MTTARDIFYKPYAVNGEQVGVEAIKAAEKVLRTGDCVYGLVSRELMRAGISSDNSERAADRLLQRARKLGIINYVRGSWRSTPERWAVLEPKDV